MAYCTKCGKQNSDAAKFCTGCGISLIKSEPDNQTPVNIPPFKQKSKKKMYWILLGVIVLIGIGVGTYFIFFNKNEKSVEDDKVTNNMNVPDNNTKVSSNQTEVSNTSPISSNQGISSTEISKNDQDRVRSTIENFYDAEDREDVNDLLSFYRFPIDKYYQYNNLEYDKLHKMVVDVFNGKLYYHKIEILWSYSSVQKLANGDFKINLFANYTSSRQFDENRKTQKLHLTIILNNIFQITSIYPN